MKKPLFILLLLAALPAAVASVSDKADVSALPLDAKQERVNFLLDVGQAYLDEKDYASAVTAYERILKIDPKNIEARFILAHAYYEAKRYAESEKLFLELIEENPDDFRLLNNLAWLYATAEDPLFRDGRKAVKYAQEALILAPNNYAVWSTLAEAYYVAGEYKKAYRAINQMAHILTARRIRLSQEELDEYNEQIRKCRRAYKTYVIFEEISSGTNETAAAETAADTNHPPVLPSAEEETNKAPDEVGVTNAVLPELPIDFPLPGASE